MRPLLALLALAALEVAARADIEPGHVVDMSAPPAQREARRLASDAATALGRNDFDGAMALADKALAKNANEPWAHYVRGESQIRAGKLDEGLAELKLAERAFPMGDRWGRSIALWARGNAYHQIGRCAEAKAAFAEYIAFVRTDDRIAAEAGQAHIDNCRPAWTPPVAPAALPTPPPPAP